VRSVTPGLERAPLKNTRAHCDDPGCRQCGDAVKPATRRGVKPDSPPVATIPAETGSTGTEAGHRPLAISYSIRTGMVMSDNGLPARIHGAKGAGSGPSANCEETCGDYVGAGAVPDPPAKVPRHPVPGTQTPGGRHWRGMPDQARTSRFHAEDIRTPCISCIGWGCRPGRPSAHLCLSLRILMGYWHIPRTCGNVITVFVVQVGMSRSNS
jgi:hypothetical protein